MIFSQFKLLTLRADQLPEDTQRLARPPLALQLAGQTSWLSQHPRLAVVGSRKMTDYGALVTSRLLAALAPWRPIIISGLAYGVDAAAHKAAIDNGCPTVAVLPAGLNQVYPRAHQGLAERILEAGGALVSEYPPNQPPRAHHFIERNRLVAALADALLVTEAGLKSGTMHTVAAALELGRTVLAVPGSIAAPQSAGSNNLLKSGAVMVTEVGDIVEALGLEPTAEVANPEDLASNREEAAVLKIMADGITDTAELQIRSGLSPAQFNQTLTLLELSGHVGPLGGGHYGLRS